MGARVITEDDLKHFQRNGARVRGGVDRDTQLTTENRPVRYSGSKPSGSATAGAIPAPSPSRSHRYEYQGQVYKSKTEVRFAMRLDAEKFAGTIYGWQYEPVNFRLPGKKNYYKPDFLVRFWKGSGLIFYDTKGFNKSDERSLVKIKTAAGLNTWAVFKQVKWIKGAWIERGIET